MKTEINKFEEQLENDHKLITEAIGDVIAIATMNEYDVAMELIRTQFVVIDRQDLEEEINATS